MQLKLEAGKRLSIREIEVAKLVAKGFSNSEIAEVVSERLGSKMTVKAVEDTFSRIYQKVDWAAIQMEVDEPDVIIHKRIAKRVALARAALKAMEEQVGMPTTYSSDEQDFYCLAIDLIQRARFEHVRFATKTPALLLPRELFYEARKIYRKELVEEVASEHVKAQYLFCLDTTLEALKNEPKSLESSAVRDYLTPVVRLLESRPMDLRFAGSKNFNSLILGEKRGAVLFQDPSTDNVVLVEFVSGPRLLAYKHYFDVIFDRATRVDSDMLRLILRRIGIDFRPVPKLFQPS